jgi:hypothetical protein
LLLGSGGRRGRLGGSGDFLQGWRARLLAPPPLAPLSLLLRSHALQLSLERVARLVYERLRRGGVLVAGAALLVARITRRAAAAPLLLERRRHEDFAIVPETNMIGTAASPTTSPIVVAPTAPATSGVKDIVVVSVVTAPRTIVMAATAVVQR